MNVEEAALRYREHSRMAEGFARGKMRGDPVYAAVMAHVRPQMSVLDVGCGEGYLLALAAQKGAGPLIGIDHDERRLAQGRAALADLACTWLCGDVREAELPEADLICCLDVLHYQPPAQQDAIIERMVAALRPAGTLLIRDGASDGGLWSTVTALSERAALALGRHRGDGVFFRPHGELAAAVEAAGLQVDTIPCSEGTPFANHLIVGRA